MDITPVVPVPVAEIYAPKLDQKYDFNDNFYSMCAVLRKLVREDWDAVFAATGKEGSSKSTLINQIGFHVDDNYTLENNVLYSPSKKEISDKIMKTTPRFSLINADEAIKILYKLQFHSPMQIFLNKLYRLCRQENKITGLAMPRFYEFNEGFRNHRIEIWMHVVERGVAVVFMKDWSPFVKDPWWFDENQKIIERNRQITGKKLFDYSTEDKIRVFQECKNFWGVITYPDLDEPLRIRYKQLSTSHKYEGLETEYEQQEAWSKRVRFYHTAIKSAILDMRTKDPHMTNKDVGKKLHISDDMVGKILKGVDEVADDI